MEKKMTHDAERDREISDVPIRKIDKSKWPRDVRPISFDDMDALGVSKDGLLHWHGQPVATRRKFEVRGIELWLLGAATIGTLLQGIAAMFPFIPAKITIFLGL